MKRKSLATGFGRHIAASLAVMAIFLASILAAAFSGTAVSVPAAGAGLDRVAAPENVAPAVVSADTDGLAAPAAQAQGGGEELAVAPAPVAAAPQPQAPADKPPANNPEAPAEQPKQPDAPSASAVDPGLAPPANFTAQFYYSGSRRVALSWQAVSYPVYGYWVLRWSGGDFASMLSIFRQLAALDPSLEGQVDALDAQIARLSQSGYTYAERNAVLDDVEAAMDPLLAAIVATPGADDLVEDIVNLADAYWVWGTSYNDTSFSNNTYYLYIVASYAPDGDTSPASNCEGAFTVNVDSSAPARPTGFVATAYDPGVGLVWNRNTEADLAGYNVYLREGSRDIQLNTSLITTGAEYFHMTGVAGATYRVRAFDLNGNRSNYASATAVLAPATTFGVDDPAWAYAGQWSREDYTTTVAGGRILRVAHDPGTVATVTFTGRMVKVYSARYSRCGTMNVYIDGELRGSFDLYYDGGYYPNVPGGQFIPPLWQQMTFEVTGLSQGTHTLTVEATGIAGAGGDTFVNFDYAVVR